MPRYSWVKDDGHVEHFDSKEEMEAAKRQDSNEVAGCILAVVGFVGGGLVSYVLLKHFGGMDWPKWARFTWVATGAVSTAYVLARLAGLIKILVGLALLGGMVTWLVRLIWDNV